MKDMANIRCQIGVNGDNARCCIVLCVINAETKQQLNDKFVLCTVHRAEKYG